MFLRALELISYSFSRIISCFLILLNVVPALLHVPVIELGVVFNAKATWLIVHQGQRFISAYILLISIYNLQNRYGFAIGNNTPYILLLYTFHKYTC